MKLFLTDAARRDLQDIGDWIAESDPQRAVSFIEEIELHCRNLTSHPLSRPLVPRYEDRGVRRSIHGRYLIFYRIEADRLVVLHVLSGSMDWEPMLFGKP